MRSSHGRWDARKEDELMAFLNDADKHAGLEGCIFNVGANVDFPIFGTTDRVFRKGGTPPGGVSLRGANRHA